MNTGQFSLHLFNSTCIFNLHSGKLTENTSTNVKENLAILLGIIIPICMLFVLMFGCYVFYRKSKFFVLFIYHPAAVRIANKFEPINLIHSSIKDNIIVLQRCRVFLNYSLLYSSIMLYLH